MVDVVHRFDLGVAQLHDVVEARHGLAHVLERGLQRAERLHVCARADELIMVEDRDAVLVLHSEDGIGEDAIFPRLGRALLAFDRIGVDVVAGKAVLGGDQVSGDALRREIAAHGQIRVNRQRAAV